MIVLGALLLAATPACDDVTTQSAMTGCARSAEEQADRVMSSQWRTTYTAMKRRDAADTSRAGGFGYAAALLASQRAWLRYRDAQCVIAGGEFAGGTAQPMAVAQCRARLTEARTDELHDLDWRG